MKEKKIIALPAIFAFAAIVIVAAPFLGIESISLNEIFSAGADSVKSDIF